MDSPLQAILEDLASLVRIGLPTIELETTAAALLRLTNCEPAFLGYQPQGAPCPYPHVLCVSINNEVIHGRPSATRKVMDGDVVSLDLGLKKTNADGTVEFDDGALTVIAGSSSRTARKLVAATKMALDAGIQKARAWNTTHDIARAIEAVAKKFNLGIVKGFGGHGIGTSLHMPPHVPNEPLGVPEKLVAGTRIAIEPMFSSQRGDIRIAEDGWTVKLAGGGIAAHFEKTVMIR